MDPIERYISRHGVTDPETLRGLRDFAAMEQGRYHYYTAPDGAFPGIEAAAVLYEANKYSAPEYKAAVKFDDGRIALLTAVRNSDAAVETGSLEEESCRLLERICGLETEHVFSFEVAHDNAEGLKFPKPSQGSVIGYHLPWALNWMVNHNGVTPSRRPANLFNDTVKHDLSVNIWNDPMDVPVQRQTQDFEPWRRAVIRAERRRFHEAQAAFMKHLDPEILAACRKVGIFSPGAYNWLAGGGDPARKEWRLQAAHSYSLFFCELCESKLTDAIDRGEPLKPLLAQRLGQHHHGYDGDDFRSDTIKQATVQRLQNTFNPGTDLQRLPKSDSLWSGLDALPPQWWPQSDEDKAAFATVSEAVSEYRCVINADPVSLLQGWRGEWQKARQTVTKGSPYGHIAFKDGLNDFLHRLEQVLALPVLLQAAARQEARIDAYWLEYCPVRTVRDLFRDQPMKQTLEQSERWHDRLTTVNVRMDELKILKGNIETPLTWPPLTTPQTTPDGIRIVPLTSKDELAAEGSAMNHCVGGYSAACYTGNNFIISIRAADGTRLSTLQLIEDGGKLRDGMHSGPGNATPCPAAVQAKHWYLGEIAAGRLRPDWEAIYAARSEAKDKIEHDQSHAHLIKMMGFDPYNPDSCRRAYEIFRPFLPKACQTLDYDGWLAETKIESAAAACLTGQKKQIQKSAPAPLP